MKVLPGASLSRRHGEVGRSKATDFVQVGVLGRDGTPVFLLHDKGSFVRRRSNGLRKRGNGQSRVYWRHTEACLYRELG